MKIRYKFVTEIVEIEVDEEFGKLINEMNLKEASRNRTLRNHEIHLDTQNDYSIWVTAENNKESSDRTRTVEDAFDKLSDKQREFIQMLYGPEKITAKKYAEIEGVSPAAIASRKKAIKKILKKFYDLP